MLQNMISWNQGQIVIINLDFSFKNENFDVLIIKKNLHATVPAIV